MPEFAKTLIFVGVAALAGLLALVLRPPSLTPPELKLDDKLFADISDATVADALEIVRYDKDAGEAQKMKVARSGDGWVIASHNDYPADGSDSKERIQDTALTLMDLKIDGLASELTADHALLGVVSPESTQAGQTEADDIGTLITLENDEGRKLAQLIVGRNVEGQKGQRFVRKEGDARVYTAKIDVEKLSTKFDDWIETDLLGIEARNIRQIALKDYTADLVVPVLPNGQILPPQTRRNQRGEMTVAWDQQKGQWELREFAEFRDKRLQPSKLTENEQLNKEKLNGLKSAIDELKIIDVESKPSELMAGVKADDDLLANEALRTVLASRGFYPSRGELLGSSGELLVQTDDGVEYVLRFGNDAGIESGEKEAKLKRYLLVSARVAEDQFQPQPPSTIPPAGEDEDDAPLSGAGGDAGEPGEAAADAPDAAGEAEDPEVKAPPVAEEVDLTGDKPADEPVEGPPDATAADEPQAADDAMAAMRKLAEAKVEELNKKFSKWFYVVSEDVYKDLRLGRFDVIQQKDEAAFGLDELRDLDKPLPPPDGP